jgi:hypothetical protein
MDGQRKYLDARRDAQQRANETGFDYGLEPFEDLQSFHVFMLPRRENRYGHETRCEVVMCERLSKCQPGHGPVLHG